MLRRLVLLPALAAAVLALAGPAGGTDLTDVTVCVVAPLSTSPDGVQAVVGALGAIDDFNNCTTSNLLGGCAGAEFRTLGGIRVVPIVIESQGGLSAIHSAAGCVQAGAAFIIGDAASDATASVATTAAAFRLPTVSYGAPSSALSDSGAYPYLLRTSYSYAVHARVLRDVVVAFGWVKSMSTSSVGLLHPPDMEDLTRNLAREFRQTEDAPTLVAPGFSHEDGVLPPAAFESATASLRRAQVRVIILAVPGRDLVDVALALEAAGMLDPRFTYVAMDIFGAADALRLRSTVPEGEAGWATEGTQERAMRKLLQGLLLVGEGVGVEARRAMRQVLDEWSLERLVGLLEAQEAAGQEVAGGGRGAAGLDALAQDVAPAAFALEVQPVMAHAYEAAWAAAFALSALAYRDAYVSSALGQLGQADPPPRSMVGRAAELVEIALGDAYQWPTAMGGGSFDAVGDRHPGEAPMGVRSCQVLDDRGCAGAEGVATWSHAAGVNIARDPSRPWLWRDGSAFPSYVPPGFFPSTPDVDADLDDDRGGRGLDGMAVAIGCLVVAVLVAVGSALLFGRARRMQREVSRTLGYKKDVDLDSPITKVLKVLEQISQGVAVPKHEADGLRLSILSSPNLFAPDASHIAGMVGTDVSKFLMYNAICPNDDAARKAYFREITLSEAGSDVESAARVRLSETGMSRFSTGGSCRAQRVSSNPSISEISLAPPREPINALATDILRGDESDASPSSHAWGVDDLGSSDGLIAEAVAGVLDGTARRGAGREGERGSGPFEMDIWEVEEITCGRPLYFTSMHVVRRAGLIDELKLDVPKFRNFLQKCESGYYEENPYHNSTHAADVVARLAVILDAVRAKEKGLPAVQHLAALLAAVVHDFLHPGTSNSYHVATGNALAIHFNDQHVLENHSLTTTLMMVDQPDMDFMAAMSRSDRKAVRKTMIAMVLSTDLALHFDALTEFSTRFPSGSGGDEVNFASSPQLVLPFLKMAVKAADLGHTALPVPQHVEWVQRLEDEFFVQGDNERREGIPISPLMDRERPGPCSGENQVGFFRVIVMSLYERLAEAFPETEPLRAAAAANLGYWEGSMEPALGGASPPLPPVSADESGHSNTPWSPTTFSDTVEAMRPPPPLAARSSNSLLDRVSRALGSSTPRRRSSGGASPYNSQPLSPPRSGSGASPYSRPLSPPGSASQGSSPGPLSYTNTPGVGGEDRPRSVHPMRAASYGTGSVGSVIGRPRARRHDRARRSPSLGGPAGSSPHLPPPGPGPGPPPLPPAPGAGVSPPAPAKSPLGGLSEGTYADRRRIDDAFRLAKGALLRARNASAVDLSSTGSLEDSPQAAAGELRASPTYSDILGGFHSAIDLSTLEGGQREQLWWPQGGGDGGNQDGVDTSATPDSDGSRRDRGPRSRRASQNSV